MGKKRNNKWKKPKGNKRRKVQRYWIEDCSDKILDELSGNLTILITRVELHDDHHPSKSSPDEESKNATDDKQASQRETAEVAKPIAEDRGNQSGEPPKNRIKLDTLVHADGQLSDNFDQRKSGNEGPFPSKQGDPIAAVTLDDNDDGHGVRIKRLVPRGSPSSAGWVANFRHRPHGDCGDGVVNPHSDVQDKYWAQRKRLFRRFDEGIKLDKEGWFSVTPEAIAEHIAEKMTAGQKDVVVLDAFVGAGGNAIAFANRPEVSRVICVDIHRERLEQAAHNLGVYHAPCEKISLIHADASDVLSLYDNGINKNFGGNSGTEEIDKCNGYNFGGLELLPDRLQIIFLSPPWGGSDYLSCGSFTLKSISLNSSTDGDALLNLARRAIPSKTGAMSYYLPKNIDGEDIARCAVSHDFLGELELEQNILNGKLKTVTAYFKRNL